jgi:hypothetical protein
MNKQEKNLMKINEIKNTKILNIIYFIYYLLIKWSTISNPVLYSIIRLEQLWEMLKVKIKNEKIKKKIEIG